MANIDIWTESLPDPKWYWDPKNPVAGTTKFYVRLAEGLAKRGYGVTVRFDGPEQDHNGVCYRGRSVPRHADVKIDCNELAGGELHWSSKYGFDDFLSAGYRHIFLLSGFHASTIIRQSVLPNHISILPLASDFSVDRVDLASRPKRCCYTSSPDRGGTFLQQIWPDVRRETGFELVQSDYASGSDVEALYASSRFWLHPAIGVELFCLSAVEAQAMGCYPIYAPHMALPETCRYGVAADLFSFKQTVIEILNSKAPSSMERQRALALAKNPLPTWDGIVDEVEALL